MTTIFFSQGYDNWSPSFQTSSEYQIIIALLATRPLLIGKANPKLLSQ